MKGEEGAPDREAGRRASRAQRRAEGARQRIRDAYPLCLTLLHGDNTHYESFMRSAFINNTHTLSVAFFLSHTLPRFLFVRAEKRRQLLFERRLAEPGRTQTYAGPWRPLLRPDCLPVMAPTLWTRRRAFRGYGRVSDNWCGSSNTHILLGSLLR